LNLRFEKGQMRVGRQDPPWKVVRAFPQEGGNVLVHLHNVSGGVVGGDRLALGIDVAAGAAAQITTTGATRLYRHRAGAPDSQQSTDIAIGEGGMLEYLPDPVIPYAGARHSQRTEIRLAAGATLFWWEVLAPGRQASGEQFAFDRLHIETRIVSRTAATMRPLLHEVFALEPARATLNATARLGRFSWTASLNICQEGREPAFWRRLEDELTELAAERTRINEVIWGASTLAWGGVTVRGLSITGRHLHAALTDFWRAARLAMTGTPAIPPRKVY
jgi:urease accessory protein